MKSRERIKNIFLYAVFGFYLLFLIKLLFLSRVSLTEIFENGRTVTRPFNLIPFATIREYISGLSENVKQHAFGNIIGNIAVFVPLGACLMLFRKDKRITKCLLLVFNISLGAELIQFIFGLGAADIDDVLLNCTGGLIGILAYMLLARVLPEEKKQRTAFAAACALCLPALLYLLFAIQMRF